MIICLIKGGLCNQLFQIFATIAYGIQYNHKFIFPYIDYLPGVTQRRTYWDDFLFPLKKFTTTEEIKTNDKAEGSFVLPNRNILIHNHEYKEIPRYESHENLRLDGYFQSYRYFETYEKTIFSMIRLESQMKKVKEEYGQFFEERGRTIYTISMHFRLGDYKHLQHSHNLLPYEYYERSLEKMLGNLERKNIRILYFCEKEDNETVSAIVSKLMEYTNQRIQDRIENLEYIKVWDTILDWKQLLLMACCDSHIIANSTFSWWGAYMNQSREKMVCYPSVWFGPILRHNYVGDMFPPSWIKIES